MAQRSGAGPSSPDWGGDGGGRAGAHRDGKKRDRDAH